MHQNQITEIVSQSFVALMNLKMLDLINNPLEEIGKTALKVEENQIFFFPLQKQLRKADTE